MNRMIPRGVWIPSDPLLYSLQGMVAKLASSRIGAGMSGRRAGSPLIPSGYDWPPSGTIPLTQRPFFHLNSMTFALGIATNPASQELVVETAMKLGYEPPKEYKRKGESDIEYNIRNTY